VTRFDPEPGEGGQGRRIEGVIHPGGEPVWTSDSDLAIRRFVSPADDTGRRVPMPEEIEGQRIAVWYWPQHTVYDALIGMAFVGVGLFCFRGGVRSLKLAVPPGPREQETRGRRSRSPGQPGWTNGRS
jgi:hypothetical protein